MRLLHTSKFFLSEFPDDRIPLYAILSHTWADEEILLSDFSASTYPTKKQWHKVEGVCKKAREDGYTWIWIDTCCIDKTSSAELSEAINSMYRWYEEASVCYVYLVDYSLSPLSGMWTSPFQACRWFTRGWTLQELLASAHMIFFDREWVEIGTKLSLADEISAVTGIDIRVLLKLKSLNECNIAYRLSWMAGRITSRGEDKSYAMLGIFDLNMPLLYGEGSEKAFLRLQGEILRNFEDDTLLLFTHGTEEIGGIAPILATSPDDFCRLSSCGHARLDYSALKISRIDFQRRQPKDQSHPSPLRSEPDFQTVIASKPRHLTLPVCLCPNERITKILPVETDEMRIEARLWEMARYRLFDRSKNILFPVHTAQPRRYSLALLNVYRVSEDGQPLRMCLNLCEEKNTSDYSFSNKIPEILELDSFNQDIISTMSTYRPVHLKMPDRSQDLALHFSTLDSDTIVLESPVRASKFYFARGRHQELEGAAAFQIGPKWPPETQSFIVVAFDVGSKSHHPHVVASIMTVQSVIQTFESLSQIRSYSQRLTSERPTDRLTVTHAHRQFSVAFRRCLRQDNKGSAFFKIVITEAGSLYKLLISEIIADSPWGLLEDSLPSASSNRLIETISMSGTRHTRFLT